MNILNWNLFLINEAKIQFFSDFEEILQLMKSPISKSILDLKDKDVNIDFNYFGLTDKEDIITFVQDSKVGEDNKIIYEVISYPWFMLDTYVIRERFGLNLKYESYPDVGTIGYIKNGITTIYNEKNPGGFILDEPYVAYKDIQKNIDITLDDHHYFVMGDNRAQSYDSRDWGALDSSNIRGQVLFRVYPFKQMGYEPGKYSFSQ